MGEAPLSLSQVKYFAHCVSEILFLKQLYRVYKNFFSSELVFSNSQMCGQNIFQGSKHTILFRESNGKCLNFAIYLSFQFTFSQKFGNLKIHSISKLFRERVCKKLLRLDKIIETIVSQYVYIECKKSNTLLNPHQ